jgi:putative methanogenesis marker domain 9
MATSVIKQFDDAKDLFTMGASIVCLPASTDPEFADWLAEAMVEYGKIMGWYNAPKHICAGGDLRGLAFCCPPVKNCPIHGALKKLGMTPEEFAKRKQQIARGTILDQEVDTCFGSLIWCCKITKPCYMRDAALRRLRISEAEYMVLKKNVAERLLNKSF